LTRRREFERRDQKKPKLPPYVRGSLTSLQAAESIAEVSGSLRSKILAHISASGIKGMTCDQCEEDLGMSHQTTSARIRELRRDKAILDTGLRRKTRSGRNAAVYVASISGGQK
jgi:hypothetical protein